MSGVDTLPSKDPAILSALAYLSEHLGAGEFAIADHWVGDLCAVGLARRDELSVLAYISCYGEAEGWYGFELELLPPAESEATYSVASRGNGVTLAELAAVVIGHLAQTT